MKSSEKSVAETLLANMYRVVNSERPTNPDYYDKISAQIKQLLQDLKDGKLSYAELIKELIEHVKKMRGRKGAYPSTITTLGLKAIYDNLDKNEALALNVHNAVKANAKDGWRNNSVKRKKVHNAVEYAFGDVSTEMVDDIVNVISQYTKEY